jgi:hypothetical protein
MKRIVVVVTYERIVQFCIFMRKAKNIKRKSEVKCYGDLEELT